MTSTDFSFWQWLGLMLFSLLSFPVLSQPQSQEATRADLQFLKESIMRYNPALQAYNPRFEEEVDSLLQEVKGESSLFEYFEWLSRICALSNEGHFGLGTWQDPVHRGIATGEVAYLPLAVEVMGGKVYVWRDLSQEGPLSPDDEILSINQVPIQEILQELYACSPGDGKIMSYQEKKISAGFAWMYHLYLEQVSTYTISYRAMKGKETQETQLSALTNEEQKEVFNSRYAPSEPPKHEEGLDAFYSLEIKPSHALLRLKSFSYRLVEAHKLKAPKFYREIFKQLKEKGVQHLIIDLRGNTGGRNEFADEMVPFFRSEKVESPFLKKTLSWEGKEKTYKLPRRHRLAFAGKLYLLTDGMTYSAGASLARYLKELGGATVIGEEGGTRYEGFAAGSTEYIFFPSTQIRIGIPRYHILFPPATRQQTRNRGILPEHRVKVSIEDLVAGKDPVMAFCLQLINESEGKP